MSKFMEFWNVAANKNLSCGAQAGTGRHVPSMLTRDVMCWRVCTTTTVVLLLWELHLLWAAIARSFLSSYAIFSVCVGYFSFYIIVLFPLV